MRILIIDRDRLAVQLITSRLADEGHEIVVEPVRNDAFARLEKEHFDVVMIDPAPLPSARPIVLAIKKMALHHFVYMILMTHGASVDEVIRMGMNDYISKPLDSSELKTKIANAAQLVGLGKTLRDNTKDIRTDGVVFGKRPFIHLFHSALDRAARYGEQAFLLFFKMNNFHAVAEQLGSTIAIEKANEVALYLAKLRRQSDFLARIDDGEFVLIMQRPSTGTEPIDASERFKLALKEFDARLGETKKNMFTFTLNLVELPMGNSLFRAQIPDNSNFS